MNIARIKALIWKEWCEISRDRLFLTMAFLVPTMVLMVLGYGLSLDVEDIPFSAIDYDRSEMSREYLHRFIGSRYFDFQGEARDERELEEMLADSKIRFAIIVPPKFQERLLSNRPVEVQSLIDGVFPYRAQVSKGYVTAINANFNNELLSSYMSKVQGVSLEEAKIRVTPLRLETRYLYNQAILSRWSMTAGLIMLVLMFVPPFLTALSVVREKENGSIYNIYSSTITRGEFIFGKLFPYMVISYLNVFILWWLVIKVFGTPFKGNLPFFFLASFVFVVCTTGIGLLVSLVVRTQATAALLTAVITFVPAILYSGLLVPIESMDVVTKVEAHLFPGIYYLSVVWGSFLKGLGWTKLWGNVFSLVIYATIVWVVSILSFRKRVRQ